MRTIDITQANIETLVDAGDEVALMRDGVEVARLVPAGARKQRLTLGEMLGEIPDGERLPVDEEWDAMPPAGRERDGW